MELWVDGVVAGKKTSFIVDTGATFSLLTSYSGPTQDSEITVKGVSGVPLRPKISPPLLCQFRKSTLITLIPHNVSVPNGTPRERFAIQIGSLYYHTPPQYSLCTLCADGTWTALSLTPDLPLDVPTSDPQVWDTDHPSIAKHHPPVHIILKDPSTIITQQQYSLTPEAHKGLKPIIDHLLQASILIPTHSPHNTPILAVRKGPNSWRLVQDL